MRITGCELLTRWSRLAFLAALSLTMGQVALAEPIQFNTTGGGVGNQLTSVQTFSEGPGNVLAVNAQTLIQNAIANNSGRTADFTAYFQSNMTLLDPNTQSVYPSPPGSTPWSLGSTNTPRSPGRTR